MYANNVPHSVLKCDAVDFVKSHFDPDYHNDYLVFDRDNSNGWADAFDFWAWSGVRVNPNIPGEVPKKQAYIAAHVGPDPHLRLLMQGYYVRFITVESVFKQFPGPYSAIVMANTGHDRQIWEDESISVSLPKVYVLADDGHNEQVIKIALKRGYSAHLSDQWLVLVHGS